jgi:Reverse transcriptase (RNA-dependent DNA polymerase)
MEGVLQNFENVIAYIDNLLVHSDTHEKHLQVLEQVLDHLQQNHLKIHLEKCIFGNKEVSYLGFTLTPEGIKSRKNKLKLFSKQNFPTTSKPSDPLSDCAISSRRTSRNSPSLLPPIN